METVTGTIPLEPLLLANHEMPVVVLQDGRVVASNGPARVLLGATAELGGDLSGGLDERSLGKLAYEAAKEPWTMIELQARGSRGDFTPVRFLAVSAGGKTLLIGSAIGLGYTEAMGRELLEMHAELANVVREISRRNAELSAARERLEKIGALRDELVATMAHDLKAPLTSIKLQATVIERTTPSGHAPDLARRARSISRSVDRMTELIDDLLDAACLDAGAVTVDRAPVCLADVAADVADSTEAISARAGVALEVRARSPGLVLGDRLRLSQILTNLVDNAIRHTPASTSVVVTVEDHGDAVRCSVRDHGPGVTPGERLTIFERFSRGGDRKRAGSVGLGLYIVKRLVELHRGRVFVEHADPGAVFVFELPKASELAACATAASTRAP